MSDSGTLGPGGTATTNRTDMLSVYIQLPTGVNFLLVIIYAALVVILVVIFVQRLVQRFALKFSKGYADVIKHAPKALKEDIDRRLLQTLRVVHEPRLLSPDDDRFRCLDKEDVGSEREQYNYLYRMKAVDDIKQLEDALCRTDKSLKRPPLKDFKQHLKDVKSHSSGVMKNVRSSQLKLLTDMYEHARYKQENFEKKEYDKFTEVLSDVISGIEQKSKKKRVKKQAGQRNVNNSNSEGAASKSSTEKEENFSEVEPLLEDSSKKKQ